MLKYLLLIIITRRVIMRRSAVIIPVIIWDLLARREMISELQQVCTRLPSWKSMSDKSDSARGTIFVSFPTGWGLSAAIFCQHLDSPQSPFIPHPRFLVCRAERSGAERRAKSCDSILKKNAAARPISHGRHLTLMRTARESDPRKTASKGNKWSFVDYVGKIVRRKENTRAKSEGGGGVWMRNMSKRRRRRRETIARYRRSGCSRSVARAAE